MKRIKSKRIALQKQRVRERISKGKSKTFTDRVYISLNKKSFYTLSHRIVLSLHKYWWKVKRVCSRPSELSMAFPAIGPVAAETCVIQTSHNSITGRWWDTPGRLGYHGRWRTSMGCVRCQLLSHTGQLIHTVSARLSCHRTPLLSTLPGPCTGTCVLIQRSLW